MSRNISMNPNPKRILSGLLALILLFLIVVPVHAADITNYGDAQDHWAYEALTWAVNEGVVVGTSENRIDPDGNLTRAQMAAMIDRLFGTYESADISRYTDVARGSWHYDYIAQAVNMGTFTGYSNNRMGPDENITREQAILVLARTVCLPAASTSALSRFPDQNEVGAWAADSVSAMVERGYISGYNDGRLNPKGEITRAEMAQIMCNIFQIGDICRCLCIPFPLPQCQEAALEIESVSVVFSACFVICIKEVSAFFRVIACML